MYFVPAKNVFKHMALASPKEAKTTMIYATVWNQLFIFSPYIIGLCGILLLPNLKDHEMVIPELAFKLFPGVIAAIALTAIMSAIMSTVAALLLLTGNHGAIHTNYEHKPSCYNKTTHAYHDVFDYHGSGFPIHHVLVVGWNDDFPKGN